MTEDLKLPEHLEAALIKFERDADHVGNAMFERLVSHQPPEVIYHYTNDVGLRGIIESGQLHLTDMFNLNDPSELSHGFSHAVKILTNMTDRGTPQARVFARLFANYARRGLSSTAHFFVTSFSSCGDDLGQWRAYADNGRGYALGFDGKLLTEIFTKKDGELLDSNCTFPVIYDEKEIEEIHRQLITIVVELLAPLGEQMDATLAMAYSKRLSVTLSLYVLRAALFFKHPAYSNEQEYRFLQIFSAGTKPERKRKYRPYELVNYREFNWGDSARAALRNIVVGPSADVPKATRFANACLEPFEGMDVALNYSEIPYRAI